MSYTAPTTRTREKPQGDEEVGKDLRLGEFEGVPSLSLSEARVLINAVLRNRNDEAKKGDTEVLQKSMEYLDMFARFKQQESVTSVERLLAAVPGLEPFERSQLATLCCETVDEAILLIPSLDKKIDHVELQALLDEILRLRQFNE